MTKVVDRLQTLTGGVSRLPLPFLFSSPNCITQSIQRYDGISVGTSLNDLCAKGGEPGKSDAMLPSVIYIE